MTIKSSLFQTDTAAHAKPYQKQLADKKSHLHRAKQCLLESSRLMQQYHERIAAQEQQLVLLDAQISQSPTHEELRELQDRKEQIQQALEQAPALLAPYLIRYEQLEKDIVQFEAHIRELILLIQKAKPSPA